jgi:hypothetical protein
MDRRSDAKFGDRLILTLRRRDGVKQEPRKGEHEADEEKKKISHMQNLYTATVWQLFGNGPCTHHAYVTPIYAL